VCCEPGKKLSSTSTYLPIPYKIYNGAYSVHCTLVKLCWTLLEDEDRGVSGRVTRYLSCGARVRCGSSVNFLSPAPGNSTHFKFSKSLI